MEGSFTRTLLKLLAWVGGILLVIVAVLHVFFVDRYVVANNAMAPTMFAGDEVLAWRDSNPDMGTISVCENPRSPGQLVIGRVIAKLGMTIKTVRNQLEIERTTPDRDVQGSVRWHDEIANTTVDMSYGVEHLGNTDHLYFQRADSNFNIRETQVRRGYYLMGDNRTAVGLDSRAYGEVEPVKCRGNVFMRLRPSETQGPGDANLPHGWLEILD